MRVAVASWTARHAGGIESYLGPAMQALTAAGVDVAFFHEVDAPNERQPIDIAASVARFNVSSSGVARALSDLSAWKPDVVYLHGLHDPDTADRLLDLAPSVTFVHTYIGTCISGSKTHLRPRAAVCSRRFGPACLALYFPRRCGGSNPVTMLNLYRSQGQRQLTLKKQAAVVTHSEHMRKELENHGVDARVLTFPVGTCDLTRAAAEPEIDLLFAGRMDAVKGGDLLIDALPQVVAGLNRPLRVQFCGDGPERGRWQRQANSLAAGDARISIHFAGWSDEKQLAAHMRKSRLLVVPSVWPEPFGSVGMSAARYGVPAAAFAVGGIPQWLRDGVNGHLAAATPPTAAGLADAIFRCLRDPAHHADLSRGATETSARFTMDRHVPELMDVFESVVHGRR